MNPRKVISAANSAPKNQEKDHHYPTPPEGTRALLHVETFGDAIWEPACGAGHMSRELSAEGYDVVSTDLVDRGFGLGRVDFLMEQRLLAPNIVTNPPFKLGEKFLRKAIDLRAEKIALLVRLNWLEGMERALIFRENRPARVWVFPWRLCITPGEVREDRGGGTVAYAWFVWERNHMGKTSLDWLSSDLASLRRDNREVGT